MNPPVNTGDAGLISGSGRSPTEGNGNPLQYSCLENPMDRGATLRGIPKQLDMTEQISNSSKVRREPPRGGTNTSLYSLEYVICDKMKQFCV